MSTIVTRSGKGSPLTHNEVDSNFSNLNTDKIQSGNTVAALTITSATVTDLAVTGITSFDGAQGTAGQVLTSAGTGNTPTWTSVSASTATNLAGGALGSVPYQLLSGTTTFLAGNTTTTPQFLTSTGVAGIATAPSYTGSTGSGNVVLATSPTLVTPILGTPTSATLTNATGLPLSTGVTGTLPVANGGTGTTTPAIVAGTGISVSGSFPNQTITNSSPGVTYTGGTGISVAGTTITNTAPAVTAGEAKAWVNFSTSTVNASYNVSSVTANGTGDYTVNFTNAFADNKYCYTLAAERALNNNGDGPKCGVRNGGVATGSFRVLIPRQTSSSGETYDTTWATVSVACFR